MQLPLGQRADTLEATLAQLAHELRNPRACPPPCGGIYNSGLTVTLQKFFSLSGEHGRFTQEPCLCGSGALLRGATGTIEESPWKDALSRANHESTRVGYGLDTC
jgi:hypothetical protein